MTPCRRVKFDPLPDHSGSSEPGRKGAVSGGLGGDPAAAPGGGRAGQGDRPAAGGLEEHGAVGAGAGGSAEVRPAPGWVDCGRGGATDPGAAEGVSVDAGHGDRGANRLGPGADGTEGPGAGASPGLPAA